MYDWRSLQQECLRDGQVEKEVINCRVAVRLSGGGYRYVSKVDSAVEEESMRHLAGDVDNERDSDGGKQDDSVQGSEEMESGGQGG